MVVDIIGMKKLLVLAFIFHLAGIILTVIAKGFLAVVSFNLINRYCERNS